MAQHAGYKELMAEIPFVLDAFFDLSPGAVASIRGHVIRSAEGMAGIVSQTHEGHLTLHSIQELKDYCYIVAGIVGEMLSELFLLDRPGLAGIAAYLRERAATFGEALQLVNILKDSAVDAKEGRRYLPAEVPKAEVFALARRTSGSPATTSSPCRRRARRAGSSSSPRCRSAWPGPRSSASRRAARARRSAGRKSFLIVQKLKRALDRGEPAV